MVSGHRRRNTRQRHPPKVLIQGLNTVRALHSTDCGSIERAILRDGSYTAEGVAGLKRVEDNVDAYPKFYNEAATSTVSADP